jgi:hypothetical protein
MEGSYWHIANNWIHDFASGLWGAAIFVMWRLASQEGTLAYMAAPLSREMFVLVLVSLVIIFITGAIRLRYWRNEGTPDELPRRRKALIAKHVGYFVVYGLGTLWAWSLLS